MNSNLRELTVWVKQCARILEPDRIVWCDGSAREFSDILSLAIQSGEFEELNEQSHPGCVVYRSATQKEIAQSTYLCSPSPEDAGPTNHWLNPEYARVRMEAQLSGAMRGRTMYVVPYLLGPTDSPHSRAGVEITDSPYVVINLHKLTHVGAVANQHIARSRKFVRALHVNANKPATERLLMHFPASMEIISLGSAIGSGAILSGHSHGLTLASSQAKEEGWLAENMSILGIEDSNGKTTYIGVCLPPRCGKTTLALTDPPSCFSNYKVRVISDNIAWMHLGADGRLWAINPECGLYDLASGKSPQLYPRIIAMTARDTIFTNIAIDEKGRPWWDGLTADDPSHLRTSKTQNLSGHGMAPSYPDAHYTVSIHQCPNFTWKGDESHGVPISAIVFGSQRAKIGPIIRQAVSWRQGVLFGAMMSVEKSKETQPRSIERDPMGMMRYCGYNMADYWNHWLSFSRKSTALPKIFHVNWFLSDDRGRQMWPGYRENFRLLKWVIDRCEGKPNAALTALGYLPEDGSINTQGLDLMPQTLKTLLRFDPNDWRQELRDFDSYLSSFKHRLPESLKYEHARILNDITT